MTVGVAAIAENDTTDPKVIISADRLITTKQQSAIEHEHQESKIYEVGDATRNVNSLGVVSGAISYAEELYSRIERRVSLYQQRQDTDTIQTSEELGQVTAQCYREMVQEKVENQVLSNYGLELDDLSKQHQFKDAFFNSILTEAEQLKEQIQQNMHMLLVSADNNSVNIYEVGYNDLVRHNQLGHAAIGSGVQPARSEFIKTEYSKSSDLDAALATAMAANKQAQSARGVGGDIDIGIVRTASSVEPGYGIEFLPRDVITKLEERQENIEERQQEEKEKVLEENRIRWSCGQE